MWVVVGNKFESLNTINYFFTFLWVMWVIVGNGFENL